LLTSSLQYADANIWHHQSQHRQNSKMSRGLWLAFLVLFGTSPCHRQF
jgi:hypothetical protein